MEIGEAVSVAIADISNQDKPTCANNPSPKPDWKARVNGLGKDGTKCSGTLLYNEMSGRGSAEQEEHGLGVVPDKQPDTYWLQGVKVVSETSFPVQAHHLIPKNFLPDQQVCMFLTEKYGPSKGTEYELDGDAPYNTDHANNGYCMPYATKLKEWKAAKDDKTKLDVAFTVMQTTRVQLHQGSHAVTLDLNTINSLLALGKYPTITPDSGSDSDDLEEGNIHDPGYLNMVKLWLDAVRSCVLAHVETCKDGCKPKKGSKKVQPLEDTARLMNRVSFIAKVFLDLNLIFACPYGATHALVRGLLVQNPETGLFEVRMQKKAGGALSDVNKKDLQHALSKHK
jgi:hypothetical protein